MKSKAEQLAEERYPYVDCGHEQLDNVTRRNIDEIRAAFIAGYEADKWIRVEDELPTKEDADENGKLLVWREMNPDQKAIEKSIMDWSMLRYCDKETTHWQPLPSPPKTT
jgi:hypothetical protein